MMAESPYVNVRMKGRSHSEASIPTVEMSDSFAVFNSTYDSSHKSEEELFSRPLSGEGDSVYVQVGAGKAEWGTPQSLRRSPPSDVTATWGTPLSLSCDLSSTGAVEEDKEEDGEVDSFPEPPDPIQNSYRYEDTPCRYVEPPSTSTERLNARLANRKPKSVAERVSHIYSHLVNPGNKQKKKQKSSKKKTKTCCSSCCTPCVKFLLVLLIIVALAGALGWLKFVLRWDPFYILEDGGLTPQIMADLRDNMCIHLSPEMSCVPTEGHMCLNDGKLVCKLPADGGLIWLRNNQSTGGGFNHTWNEYVEGFGDPEGSHWFIGLETLHLVTNNSGITFRLEVSLSGEVKYGAKEEREYSHYEKISVGGDGTGYTLQLGSNWKGYWVAGPDVSVDALRSSNLMRFSTRDNGHLQDCALMMGGGWWYNNNASCSDAVPTAAAPSWTWAFGKNKEGAVKQILMKIYRIA